MTGSNVRVTFFFSVIALAAVIVLTILTMPGARADEPDCPLRSGESATFGFTGEVEGAWVPDGVDFVDVELRGGHGGQASTTGAGGQGGLVQARLPVSPGYCMYVFVGGYGDSSNFGYGQGGGAGLQRGPGRDGAGGGGASAIQIGEATDPVVIAGGGGGGGGNGSVEWDGGAGGNGAGGAGPGDPEGADGMNGYGVPQSFDINLGGDGGAQSGPDADGGDPGSVDLFSGAGGGGGGGHHGGDGGANWVGTGFDNVEKPAGGGGGGGGDSWAANSVVNPQFLVDDGKCPVGGGSDRCAGSVSIEWIEHPSQVLPYSGKKQSTIITSKFASPIEAKVEAVTGDGVPGVKVDFSLPTGGGAGATFDLPGNPVTASATSDANGIARAPAMTANHSAGSWIARATVDGVSKPASFSIENLKASTATALHSSQEPSQSGEPVTFAAEVGAAPSSAEPVTGKVEFEVDGHSLGGPVTLSGDGIAISSPIALDPGTHQAIATFAGTKEFRLSSAHLAQRVGPGPAKVTIEPAGNPSAEGSAVQFDAAVSALPPAVGDPGGSVQFTVDDVESGAPVPLVSGVAGTTITFPASGQHLVRALYQGDTAFKPGTGTVVQSVGDEAIATTISTSDAASTFGDPLTFTAKVNGAVTPSGEVSFVARGEGIGEFNLCPQVTLVSGQAGCDVDPALPAGEFEIVADFDPDQLGTDASQGRLNQTVAQANVDVGVGVDPDPVGFGLGYSLFAQAAPIPAGLAELKGQIKFTVDGAPLGDPVPLDEGQAAIPATVTPPIAAGPHSVGARYSGDRDFRDGSAASVLTVDAAETETSISTADAVTPFAIPVDLEAKVLPLDAGQEEVEGSVQFWVDGAAYGEPVPVNSGVARKRLSGLEPGDHDVRAYFSSSADFLPSEAALVQTVDSPPPSPEGILPCVGRKVVLTAAYRLKNTVRFEGVARYALRGKRVHIKLGSKSVSRTTVRPDGTFWAAARDPGGIFSGKSKFTAKVNGHRSWPRRLSQAIELRKRTPRGTKRSGPHPRVRFRVAEGGRHKLVLARQTGCHKQDIEPVKTVRSSGKGRIGVGLPRPAKGEPYAIYRLHTKNGRRVSSPIVVRPAR